MTKSGLDVIPGNDMTRIRVVCEHQSGLIYVVPADRSWVCDQVNLPAHALAGFFRELTSLENKEVQDLMQLWGVYYRQLPRDQEKGLTKLASHRFPDFALIPSRPGLKQKEAGLKTASFLVRKGRRDC